VSNVLKSGSLNILHPRGLGLLITTQKVFVSVRTLTAWVEGGDSVCVFVGEFEPFGRRGAFIQTQTKSVVTTGSLGPSLPPPPPPGLLTTLVQYM